MSEHSGDRQTRSHDSERASDTDGGGDDSTGGDTGTGGNHDERSHEDDASQDEQADTGEEKQERYDPEDGDRAAGLFAAVPTDGVIDRAIEDGLVDPEEAAPDGELRSQVEEASAGTVTDTLALLGETLTALEAELAEERERADDLESRLRRKQADFQNYKKRQKERRAEERQRATEELIERLLDVRDNLERALDTDEGTDIRSGVESTLSQFDRELERENVERIEPDSGDAVDPVRHEVLATVPSGEAEDTIAGIHRPGYEMAGKVLRPAQVTVSEGPEHDSNDDGTDSDEAATSER